jgi:hypothetical protein
MITSAAFFISSTLNPNISDETPAISFLLLIHDFYARFFCNIISSTERAANNSG